MPARLLLALAAACAAILLVAGCGGGGSNDAAGTTSTEAATTEAATTEAATTTVATTTTPAGSSTKKKITITIENATPIGGIKRVSVSKGDTVALVVASDVSDEIHVHGYNLKRDVAAGGAASIAFVANIPGRFEVELEQHGTQIADVTVNP